MKNIFTILEMWSPIFFVVLLSGGFGCGKAPGLEGDIKLQPTITVSVVDRTLFIEKEQNELVKLIIQNPFSENNNSLQKIKIIFSELSTVNEISGIAAFYGYSAPSTGALFGKSDNPGRETELSGNHQLNPGSNYFHIQVALKPEAILTGTLKIEEIACIFTNDTIRVTGSALDRIYRFGKIIRSAGQDNCNTYRIPGLITTNSGTLIATYDNRYNNSKDLQEDIDIGMSRSTDGGQTWQPMKVILDMGEYGGRSQRLNGTGDPCVLYDHITNTIWMAALWMSGSSPDQMLWWASAPGMKPEETGQFILVKSTDDGLTWSQPVNITEQIKDPAWQLLLQGPGKGICMKNGTLVFPAQFKKDIGTTALDGGQYTSHSTIVYSEDCGSSWKIGTGAKSNTTEAQVVELGDGSIMLNMRDDRNRKDKSNTNGRAVSVTTDLGKTWTTHASSNSALPEPNCMASIIRTEITVNGEKLPILFFSNPNNKNQRTNMTIKASLNEGITWPDSLQIELNADAGYGYSCLTMVDENTIGIIYEGVKELYFQKNPVSDLFPVKK